MAEVSDQMFVKIIVQSNGKILSMPGFIGPIFESINVPIKVALSIYVEGHDISIETTPDNYLKVDDKLLLKMMSDYGITDEIIKKYIDDAKRQNAMYNKLNNTKAIVEFLIKLIGVPIPGLDTIQALGEAITRMLGVNTIYKNFDQVKDAIDNIIAHLSTVDSRIDEMATQADLQALRDYTDSKVTPLADSVTALVSMVQSINSGLADIRNGSVLGSFADVENEFLNLRNEIESNTTTLKDELLADLDKKVDKIDGMGLSSNDYTTPEKELVSTIRKPVYMWAPLTEYEKGVLIYDQANKTLYMSTDKYTSYDNAFTDMYAGYLEFIASAADASEILSFFYLRYSNVMNSRTDASREAMIDTFIIPEYTTGDYLEMYVGGILYVKDVHYEVLDSTHVRFFEVIEADDEVYGTLFKRTKLTDNQPKSFEFVQLEPVTEWVIPHHLNTYPIVMVLDGAGVEVGVLPRHQDVNGVTSKMETRITFPYPFVGRAILTKTI